MTYYFKGYCRTDIASGAKCLVPHIYASVGFLHTVLYGVLEVVLSADLQTEVLHGMNKFEVGITIFGFCSYMWVFNATPPQNHAFI